MIAAIDYTQVPEDLQHGNQTARRFHEWKASAVVRACIPLHRMFPAPQAGCPGILMYHRVVPETPRSTPTWNVTPERFRQQLSGLLKRGYVPWPMSQLIDSVHHDHELPNNVFIVTFDDGYANNYLHALPILKELNVPATIFLATAYLDSVDPFPFDDWSRKGSRHVSPDTWRALRMNECDELLASGVIEFGSHTHTHEDFRDRPDEFRESLQTSLTELSRRFGITRAALSLPYGILRQGFAGPEYFSTAKELGTTCCLTTEEELVRPGTSPFGWGRFIAEQHDTATTLAVKLDGWRDAARNRWRSLRGRTHQTVSRHL